jgi:hypothetical protein
MSFQPFQVTAPIDDFINARLKEKNRQKRGDEYLQKSSRSSEHAKVLHGAIVTRQDLPLSILYRRWSARTKTGTRLSASLKFPTSVAII